MNKVLLIFIFFYYLIIVALFLETQKDPSSSLGVGLTIVSIWVIGLIALFVLIKVKAIIVRTWLDKVGVIVASPIPAIIFIAIGS
jgi:hypothetical protein